MGVMLILAGPVIAVLVEGAAATIRRPRAASVAVVLVALAAGVSVAAIADWRAPADPRYRQAFGQEAIEQPGLIEHDAARLTSVAPWPDYGRLNDFYDFFSLQRVADLGHPLSEPSLAFRRLPWGWVEHAVSPAGPPVTIAIDLSDPPWLSGLPVRLTDRPPHIDLTADAGVQLASPVRVGWSDRPLTVAVTPAGERVTGVMVAFGSHTRVRERKDALSRRGVERYRDVQFDLHWLLMGEGRGDGAWRPRDAVPADDVVRLRVPAGSLSVAITVSARAVRTLVWRGTVGATRVDIGGPWRAIHN